MRFSNRYGHFTDDGREYVITDPRTPRPWFNYIWNERYTGLISHTGGGFSFIDSPRDNRITRMRYNCQPWDRPGRYVMVRDQSSGAYWSLSWAPTTDRPYESFECRHGQGYTRILTSCEGIGGEILYFVPRDVNGEVWRVTLRNHSGRRRKLSIFSFVELLMGNALNDLINQPNDKHFPEVHFDRHHGALVATRRYWVLNKKVSVAQPNMEWPYRVLFGTTLPVAAFDGSLDLFTGRWRSESNPIGVEQGRLHDSEITAGDPVAALQSDVELEDGATLECAVVLAVASREWGEPFEAVGWKELTDLKEIDRKFEALRGHWDRYLGAVRVDTPDGAMDTMLNVWNPYQAAVTFDMARNSGYYHGGLLFGTGMRDQFQDILGMVIADPARVRQRLLNALRFQFADGSTLHNFFKLTDTGEKTNHSDTPLWIPFGLVEYLNETGDLSILDEEVGYYESEARGRVYEHLLKALDFALTNLTKRGLPRIWNGDWNDTLDKVGPEGKGETVWGAFFLGYVLRKTFDLLELRGDRETLKRYRDAYAKLAKSIDKHCWDGEWYIRAFRDNGKPVGVAAHSQGKIFINSQSWSVISGLAQGDRGKRALASMKKHLVRPKGVQICWPSYTKVEADVGLISRCVPGKKENGAIFNHASSWAVLAFLMNGDIDFAVDLYRRMLPINTAQDIDRYEVEPYVFAEYITSPDHPTEGQASHSWLTGTAVWMFRIGLDFILGMRPTLAGMLIDPHIPSAWTEYRIERRFRGKTIRLHVRNPRGRSRGIGSMTVNGVRQEDPLLKMEHFPEPVLDVSVVLG